MTRGFTAVLPMTPNVGEEKLLSGFANCGWLKALKNSARNWMVLFSCGQTSATTFDAPRSTFACPGPSTIPVPLSPKVVPIPSAPITGGVVKQAVLKYPSNLLVSDPPRTKLDLLHPGANSARSSLMPKTLVKLLYAMVSAVPDCTVNTPDIDQPPNRA